MSLELAPMPYNGPKIIKEVLPIVSKFPSQNMEQFLKLSFPETVQSIFARLRSRIRKSAVGS
jgi:hypothetical protein